MKTLSWKFIFAVTAIFSLLTSANAQTSLSQSAEAPTRAVDPVASSNEQASCTMVATVDTAISAGTSDYLERVQRRAEEKNCGSILLRLNTPGGSLQSTRIIVENILASKIPYYCLITPQGGHAGSAGAIILQACHLNGGLNATNVGAATPVLGGGAEMSEDLRKKMINDTVSWLEGITKLRGRNLEFSKEIVTEAKALSSEEAHKEKALDILAHSEEEFLKKAQEKGFAVGELLEFPQDLRAKVLNFVADPEFAYLIFMGSLGLLYLELSHPGLIAPGVLGAMGLLLSLVAFHKMAVVWGGLGLIFLGVVFLALEIFIPSFGILAIGGLVGIFLGSVFLFDTATTGYSLPMGLIVSVVLVLGGFILGMAYFALKSLRFKSGDSDSDLQSNVGTVLSLQEDGKRGQAQILGEIWNFVSDETLQEGDEVQVLERTGLTLKVKKKE